jgi:two-component system osmolarity sensor histidine kinase EnvZ
MKLQLAMLGDDDEIGELKGDVQDMERMVEGYLAFARGEGTEVPVPTDLISLVTDVVGTEKRDGSSINLVLLEREKFVLEVRPQALKRGISNLITNAKRYADTVDVAMETGGDWVQITVDDDGPGIPLESREDVFKPFFRLDASRNPQTGGTGLGLTIARDITRNHGGDLILDDAPEGGLRARIRLPM